MKSIICMILLTLSVISAQNVNLKQVRCLVCRAIVDEFKHEISKIDPLKEIEIGQYRLDSKGNTIPKKVPLSMSEVHLSDMLESICKKMEDYVRATYKSNGKLTLLKLIADSGLNPLLNEVDIIQDGDLNKSLEYFCTDIVSEHEDLFIKLISKKETNAKLQICTEVAKYCEDFVSDEDEIDDIVDNHETENSSKTEL